MDKKTRRLLGLHRAEYEASKTSETNAWLCQGVVGVSALVAVAVDFEPVVYVASLVALGASAMAGWFTYQSRQLRDIAERSRRLLLLVEGLGYQPSDTEYRDLMASFRSSEATGKHWEKVDYYSGSEAPGTARLCSLLEESAFFSEHLLAASARLCWSAFLLSLALSLAVLLFLPLVQEVSWSLIVARIVAVLLTFIVAVDLFGRAQGYSSAEQAVRNIRTRINALPASGPRTEDLLIILGDYHSAVECAPLIPTFVYSLNVKRLNRLRTMSKS